MLHSLCRLDELFQVVSHRASHKCCWHRDVLKVPAGIMNARVGWGRTCVGDIDKEDDRDGRRVILPPSA